MSLVVLRSWGEGHPPKIRAIAPPDSDDKDEVVVPDHHGRFVTEEAHKAPVAPVPPKRQVVLRSSSTGVSSASSPSPSPPAQGGKASFTSPFKFWKRGAVGSELGRSATDLRRPDKLTLSRESSVQSIQSVGTPESPPTSPVPGSRYRNLGHEIAATIPRRQLIRETWIKDTNQFQKKKSLSVSTPALNTLFTTRSPSSADDAEISSDADTSNSTPSPIGDENHHKIRPPRTRAQRPVSYIDSIFSADGEPKFGDRPASVVQVFKKEPNSEVKKVSFDLKLSPETVPVVQIQEVEAVESQSSQVSENPPPEQEIPKVDIDTVPEVDPDFIVHKAVHVPEVEKEIVEAEVETSSVSSDNDGVDAELEALRIENSPSSPRPTVELAEPVNEMSGNRMAYQNQRATPDMSDEDRLIDYPKRPSRHHGSSNKNGSAWATVPVQCVNRHVKLPYEPVRNNLAMETDKQVERRKLFCDELLADVVIEVPVQKSRVPPSIPPPPPSNHDGIIFFDEEEEDELGTSETESTGLSERENSFEYISVFQNVKVSSDTETMDSRNKCIPLEPTKRIIGLDLGSFNSRHSSWIPPEEDEDAEEASIVIGDTVRTLVTADGRSHGHAAISHSIGTKSKLIYKWKARQSYAYESYDEDEFCTTLETMLRHYNELLQCSPNVRSNPGVQWNLSIHSGMDKKLVREAALNSGLVKSRDELRLVNESTAASVMAYEFLQRSNNVKWGKTFLNVNIGSTFIHTSGYELKNNKLAVIEASDSQTFDSPDSSFIELLMRVFSHEFILQYESRFRPAWIQMLLNFDEMKDLYFKNPSDSNYLFVPASFVNEFHRVTGIIMAECVDDNREEGMSWDSNGAIGFSADLLEEWMVPVVSAIRARLKVKSYDSVVLSGGGASMFIHRELVRLLPSVNVYLIPNPERAVVEGLVRMDRARITFQSPFSIGVGVMTPFDEKVHPEEKCVTRQGKKWCSDVWDCLIRKGEWMTIGQTVLRRSYVGAQPGQNVLVLPIFKSELEEPKLVTSPSVEKCCELRFEISKESAWREVSLVIKCFESELSIVARGSGGEVNHVSIDF